ncbi:high affinity nitrate transporter 2.7 [Silene latifolia]|uniref:high affinity nitrate transporter 2.7 n=1 Tax=Silene latifolia TaxID=37657 RepID=UPI003D788D68
MHIPYMDDNQPIKPPLAVDEDGKATVFNPISNQSPHMLAFHLSWLSLFSCFFSTFSIPPLLPIIRDDLKLTPSDISLAGAASFAGSIFSRLLMGPACDTLGPRLASATLSLITAPTILAVSLASTPLSFAILRLLVGLSLGNFVANQFWMSSMFSGRVVGQANATAAGWANTGSGIAQLIMPVAYTFTKSWRLALVVPAVFQATTAILVLKYTVDTPHGYYKDFHRQTFPKQNVTKMLWTGLKNYRGWILGLLYATSFGVELTIDNIIAQYFYDEFGLKLETAGAVAASFGLANCFSRPMGGAVSDYMGRKYGMRGRLWSLWVGLTVAGLLCVELGRVNSLWGSIGVMCMFSVFVQASSGMVFGVVPFVSTRSLGVISGMTGSGGTVGAVVTQLVFFSNTAKLSTHTALYLMGLTMLISTCSVTLLYSPQWGGMFCAPSPPTFDDEEYNLLD